MTKLFLSSSFYWSFLLLIITVFTVVSVEVTADEIVKDCSCSTTKQQLTNYLNNIPAKDVMSISQGKIEYINDTTIDKHFEISNKATVHVSADVKFEKLLVLFDEAQLFIEEDAELELSPSYHTGIHQFDKTNVFLFDSSSITIQGNNTKWTITASHPSSKTVEERKEDLEASPSLLPEGKAILLCDHSQFDIQSAKFSISTQEQSKYASQPIIVKGQAELTVTDMKPEISKSSSLSGLIIAVTQGDNSDVTLESSHFNSDLEFILEYLLPEDKTNHKLPFTAYPANPNDNPDPFVYTSDDGKTHLVTEIMGGISVSTVAVDLPAKNNLTLNGEDVAINVFCTFKKSHGTPKRISGLHPRGILQDDSVILGDRSLIVPASNNTQNSANVLSWDLKFVDVEEPITITGSSKIYYLNVTETDVDVDSTVIYGSENYHFNIDGTITTKPQISLREHAAVTFTGVDTVVAADISITLSSYLKLDSDVQFCKQDNTNDEANPPKNPYQLSASHSSFVYVFAEQSGCSNSQPIFDVDTLHSYIVQERIDVPDPSMLNSSDPFNVTGIARIFAPKIDAQNFTLNFTFDNPDAYDQDINGMQTADNYSSISTPHPLTLDDTEVLYTPDKEIICGNWTMNVTMSSGLSIPMPLTHKEYFEIRTTHNFFAPKPYCRGYHRGLAFVIVGVSVGVTLIVALTSIAAAIIYHRIKIRRQQFYEPIS
eukprot:gb/GECH01007643.1/.p1 GENE.gb/GECH01007643.1/~~gb/GECH01007643.1/.p1  ORF type:complete len:713 (+),score=186.96 gb/GECH01007643.1/:1-2139(+)